MKILLAVFVSLAALSSTVFAGAPPGWPSGPKAATPMAPTEPGEVNGGSATFTIGKDAVKLDLAEGTITKSEGVYVVSLLFKDSIKTSNNVVDTEGKILRIGFGTMKPGPAMMIMTFVARSGKVLSVLRTNSPVDSEGIPKVKTPGKCTVTITKLEEKLVEGTAECPSGMRDFDDNPSPAVSSVTFKATAL